MPAIQSLLQVAQQAAAPIHSKFRGRKVGLFFELLKPAPSDTLLDIGGGTGFGGEFQQLYSFFDSVSVLNIMTVNHPNAILGDACDVPLPDQSVDWVFSNAVIEHVGNHIRQQQMANEIRRIMRRGYFVATPNKLFPIDPHTYIPLFQFAPESFMKQVRGAYWMLSPYELSCLFPEAQIRTCGIGTSIIATYRSP